MAGVWAELLGVERVGIHDSFFALGGHSLLATRLVSRLREVCHVELPLRTVLEQPTVAALAAALERGLGAGDVEPLRPVPRLGRLPLSPSQERLWFLDQLEPGTPVYNMPAAVELRGALDPAALGAALAGLVCRHEILRTTFPAAAGVAHQEIAPAAAPPLALVDLTALPAEVRQAEGERIGAGQARRPFDLQAGPLLDTLLVRYADDVHRFLLVTHHIVSDGWSVGVLIRELGALYAAAVSGSPAVLPELPVQYADFAVWQRRRLEATSERDLAYWVERLAGEIEPLNLPTDRPRPAVQTYRAGRVEGVLEPELASRLCSFGRAEGATLFMILLAAADVLLQRLSGQDDVLVGAPVAGRHRAEVEGLIGFFLNTLVLRTSLAGDPGVRGLIARVREATLGAFAHQDLPFEALLHRLQPERDLSRTPLFQVLFNLLSLPAGELRAPGLDLEILAAPAIASKFDMTFYVSEAGGAVRLELVYNADLFDAARAEECLEQLRAVLEQMVERPAERIGNLSLLTSRARRLLPDPTAELGNAWHGAIHDLFTARAQAAPGRLAVEGCGGAWTYGELDAASNRLASCLLAGGLLRGDAVAVFAHRSAPLAVAVLGILKAGGAFTLLDPAYPPARLAEILHLASPRAWVALASAGPEPEAVEEWLRETGCPRLALPAGGPAERAAALAGFPADHPGLAVGPDDAAVLGFTSGSTGTPKGIVGRHGSLTHFYPWQCERFGMTAEDRFSVLSGLAHDPLQRDFFTPFFLGATAVVPDPAHFAVAGRLAAWMAEQRVTVAHLTPAMAQLLTERPVEGEAVAVPSLRRVLLVGDRLTRLDVARIRRLAPSVVCVNLYGSTETQRAVSFHVAADETERELEGRTERALQVLPLGRGMRDVQLLVLGRGGRLAGVGEVGEIAVRSPHLSRGYLDDPELTADRFRSNPFAGAGVRPADRLYRTGDLGRYLPNGEVVFTGRADQQVKIRGFRIELGEIEAILGGLPGVRENAVLAREEGGEHRLVAYVVPEAGAAPDAAALRAALGARLPAYMVPSAFAFLARLPITPNGKLDRRALLRTAVMPAGGGGEAALPRTATEELLATLWAGVLGVEQVGAGDDFFALGGHSLLATQLLSRVRSAFGVELPLRALFESPVLGELARRLDTERAGAAGALPAAPIGRAARAGEAPLSLSQTRLWLVAEMEPESSAYNLPAALRLRGPLEPAWLEGALERAVHRHEILRTTFPSRRGVPVQSIAPPAPVTLPRVDLAALSADAADIADTETSRLLAAEALRPFDLGRGPLWRALLIRRAADEHVLLFAMHHIIGDGWSTGVLVREVVEAYRALAERREPRLPGLAVQYADFAVWQSERLSEGALDALLAWWRTRMAGAPLVLELAADRPRPSLPGGRGETCAALLAPALSKALAGVGRREGVTLFMTLLAGFLALVQRTTGRDDLVIGTDVANRDREETEPLIGFFVNQLVLRTDLSGDPAVRTLLGRVRETALGAYAHQDLPFDRLVQELRPERDPSRHPLYQVSFTLQSQPRVALDLPGIALAALPVHGRAPKFDLLLEAAETPEGLALTAEYDAGLYEPATIARLLGHFKNLLAGLAEGPERRLSHLELLTPAERHQVVLETNAETHAGIAAFPRKICVHELVERQAALTPDALALSFEGLRLSYRDLDVRANQLAHRLRRLRVGPEVRVGLCMERSLEVVVGLLGILKAGGAYLPLDPTYPPERLAFIAEDGSAAVLLVHAATRDILPLDLPVVCLDPDWREIAGESPEAPRSGVTPANLAYVMYTSGSTGRPKGVSIPHEAVAWHVGTLGYTAPRPGDRFAQGSTHSFDAATFEVWGALAHGAALVGIPKDVMISPRDLAARLREEEISVLYLTAALFAQTASQAPDAFRPLRRLLTSGEAVGVSFFRRVVEAGPPERFLHLYGPTETTVFSCWHEVTEVPADAAMVPIGRPIAGAPHYLLDPGLSPVPLGVFGELYIGGDGLARGYLNRPALSAERFVPDPFSAVPGARLYRTGDLVRYLPNGEMEFGSRIDTQVKIRGFRIEPLEIEALLMRHPAVQEALVMAREDVPGDKRLVAYAVLREGESLSAAGMRAALRREVPDYMVPAALVTLPAFPLSLNGKVDRRALPAPEAFIAGNAEHGGLAPRTSTEAALAAIWAEVLQVPGIGIDVDFFAAGGHSLLAAQVMTRVRAAFSMELPLRALFEAATVAGLAREIDAARGLVETTETPLRPRPAGAGAPLSFAQERLWFLAQLQPASPAYNIPAAVRLRGRLDVAALAATLTEVLRRHEVLRTSFPESDGRPVQQVAPAMPFPLPVVDLRGMAAGEREPEARRRMAAEARQPFDLARGPVLRAVLLVLGETDHLLLLTLHHIVSDGWSTGVFVREVGSLYPAFAMGGTSPLPELPVQYADYAWWQRSRLTGEVMAAHLSWWRGQLGDRPPVLELPAGRPRPATEVSRAASEPFALAEDLTEGLLSLGRAQGATLFMSALAAFAAVLSAWTGQEDLVVGSPVAERHPVETEEMIGLFLNTLVLRADLAGNPRFVDLLARVRETALSAWAHRELPFERLVEEMQPVRDVSRPPLFQAMLVVQNAPPGRLELPGLELEPQPVESGVTKLDLVLTLFESARGVQGSFGYNRDLFEPATVRRMVGTFETLLGGLVRQPEERLADLPRLTGPERRQLLADWCGGLEVHPVARPLHRLFEEQAKRTPEAVAAVCDGSSLTYGGLDARANRLARHLRRHGVGPDVPVAVCVERSLDLIVALLAVLKAGGAYVPLDPAYPPERLVFLLEDALAAAASPVLITHGDLAALFPAESAPVLARTRIVRLDADSVALAAERSGPLADAPPVAAAAYVIYTSGSTGRPKGVLVTHENVVRLFAATRDHFSFAPADIWSVFHSYAFDFSVWEIWGALLTGGRAVMVPYWISRSPDSFYELLVREGVTVLNQTPSAFRQLIQADGQATDALRRGLAVRLVIFGGEALDLAGLEPWIARRGAERPRLVNMYGITETTVHVSYRPLSADDPRRAPASPIGAPLPDLRIYLLDSRGSLVPLGAPGEIHVGGAGLARGYLGRPGLTAERFVPDPFGAEPGRRLYRSGDLALYRQDGSLDFLGRADHQVKIRGFRIELGEIEAALVRHPAVREAAVLLVGGGDDRRLVAFLVPAGGAAPAAAELRDWLLGRLPDYMTPAAFVRLDALPLTSNLKLDRQALESLAGTAADAGGSTSAEVAPRTLTEQVLAATWAEVLGLDAVDVRASFFDLGGHSLLATRLVSRIRRAFSVEIPLRDVFEAPTVEELAVRIDGMLRGGEERRMPPPLEQVPRGGALPVSSGQRRMWFLHELAPDSPVYHLPAVLRLSGALDVAALRDAFSEIVRRHEVLRTRFSLAGGEPMQTIEPPTPLALPVADLAGLPPEARAAEARRLAAELNRRPFDLRTDTLLRVALLRLDGGESLLVATMHHIASDGWSIGVLLREVEVLYQAFRTGAVSPLPELLFQVADFAAWQRRWLDSGLLGTQVAWWKGTLVGELPPLELPADRPRPRLQSVRGATVTVALPPRLAADARRLGYRSDASPFMTFAAAFAALLARYTGQDSLCLGVPISGRNLAEIEGLIGFFVNTLVLRLDHSGDPSFHALLDRVRAAALGAFQHQDVPFERLVEEIQPERDLSRSPLFQTMLVFQEEAPRLPVLPGVAVTPVPAENPTTKLDLTLVVERTPEGYSVGFEYCTDLFDAVTVRRWGAHFLRLLEEAVAGEDRPLSALSLLSEAESHQIAVAWNDTAVVLPPLRHAQELFEAQARRVPEAMAITCGARRLTYGELDRAANRLAHQLRALGVGPESRVGLCLDRSPELATGIYGILKAGGAYVPLDPAVPRERLLAMLDDARATAVVTGERFVHLVADREIPRVCLDRDSEALAGWPAEAPAPQGGGDHLAYLIYTSGSTGRPNGVMISHAGLLNYVDWSVRTYASGGGRGAPAHSSIGFDLTVTSLFAPLATGQIVSLVPEEGRIAALGEVLESERGFSFVKLTPAHLEILGQQLRPTDAGGLTSVLVIGGEALRGEAVAFWTRHAPATRIVNEYGPTEAVVGCTVYDVPAGELEAGAVPIGRPIGNARIHLLGAAFETVPLGALGEIFIGGPGLARGYLGRPDLTAARFLPDPFAGIPGARLYRTGDLARHRPDGALEYHGRRDHQLKIRGYRVEPEDIQAALAEHPEVDDSAVLALPDASGRKRLIAYVVAPGRPAPSPAELRAFAELRLPEYMVPSLFVVLDALPLTPNGKLDRKALPQPEGAGDGGSAAAAPQSAMERAISAVWQEVLGVERVGIHDNFFDLGGHSLLLVKMGRRLEEICGRSLPLNDLFRFTTVHGLAGYLRETAPEEETRMEETPETLAAAVAEGGTEIAIVGMACRFPGATNPGELWRNLRQGVESITFWSDEELRAAGVPEHVIRNPIYVKAGGSLGSRGDIGLFDAGFFGFNPREAEVTDPQHRLFLECSWQALEDAGYDPGRFAGRIGVFAGVGLNHYWLHLSAPSLLASANAMQVVVGNDKDFLPTRVSYKLDLRGPSVGVQTACSTSLVAVHTACASLLRGDCEMALAGGASVDASPIPGYFCQEGGIFSPDGHCRAFDARAQGTVAGSGVGIVVLKRLRDALQDGDSVYAVIKGSAVNNDGSAKIGYTAPSIDGQAGVIAAAQKAAGVAPESISYIEAHGTGTVMGDPIEIAALSRAFRGATGRGFCALGSIKSNLGHLDTAAGVASLIKTALALCHGEIPPSLHYETPNREIDFASTPFYVNASLAPWQRGSEPRRAGVSGFGIGGTNAHVILEEAPTPEPSVPLRARQVLVLSARSAAALEAAALQLAEHLERRPELDLADVSHTLQVGRRAFAHRLAVVCGGTGEAVRLLAAGLPEGAGGAERIRGIADENRGERMVAFLFPGQGAQYVEMGAGLYESEPVFQREVDRCCDLLLPHLGLDLRDLLFPASQECSEAAGLLRQTRYTQPALFVVEYALAQLWSTWGVRPAALLGHSIGEYVAACLAGVFSLEDALRLVAERGRLISGLPTGAMLAVPLPEERVRELLSEGLSLAAVNAPALCVVSGPAAVVEALRARLEGEGVACRTLETSHAFHSAMMEPILDRFSAAVRRVSLHSPRIPFLSNVTGTWVRPDEATDPLYWVRHLRQTVRFASSVRELLADPRRILIEVGPGSSLGAMVRRNLDREELRDRVLLSSLPPQGESQGGHAFLLASLARFWSAGGGVDWSGLHAGERLRRVSLPTYPFERKRYWVEAAAQMPAASPLAPREELADWFYFPSWKRTPPVRPRPFGPAVSRWLVFADASALAEEVLARLAFAERDVVIVHAVEAFRSEGRVIGIDPRRRDDYTRLLAELGGWIPERIVYLWSAGSAAGPDAELRSFYDVLFLSQALAELGCEETIVLGVAASDLCSVTGREEIRPEKATLVGLCRVVPLEVPRVACRCIDLSSTEIEGAEISWLAAALLAEIAAEAGEPVVAYRMPHRWVPAFEPIRLEDDGCRDRLRESGVYLITGGLGGVGLELAAFLAGEVRARLALVGRSPLPPREEWERWIATQGERDRISRRLRRLIALEEQGAEVLVLTADVADLAQMRNAVRRTEERFGAIHGVIHAAGLPPGGVLQLKTAEGAAAVLAPKVIGTRVLSQVLGEVLGDRDLDFVLLCSSLAAVAAKPFDADYCAANNYLDAFAQGAAGWFRAPVVSLGWDTWREAGMAVDAADRLSLDPGESAASGMSSREGCAVFLRALHCGLPHVVVSMRSLPALLAHNATLHAAVREALRGEQKVSSSHERPDLSTPYKAPETEAERILAGIWQELLGFARIGTEDNFFELGGDSVVTIQVISRANRAGLRLTPRQVFENQTIAAMARVAGKGAEIVAEQGTVSGLAPLSPIQAWFFDQEIAAPDHWNQALLLRVDRPLDPVLLRQAVGALLAHHDALRFRYLRTGTEWRQEGLASGPDVPPVLCLDLAALPADRQRGALEAAAEAVQASLDLAAGRLLRAASFRMSDGSGRLLLVIHHLVIDAVSWRFVVEDLEAAYRQLAAGTRPGLPAKTTSFKSWGERLAAHAGSDEIRAELPFWLAAERARVRPLPVDHPGGANMVASLRTVTGELSAEETRSLLFEALPAAKARVDEMLLAALALAYRRWAGDSLLLVDLEGHGRGAAFEDVDISRTVGWFTVMYPVLVSIEGVSHDPGAVLDAVKQQLRAIPDGGLGYGLLRHLGGEASGALAALPRAEISFLYLGQLDHAGAAASLFGAAPESSGLAQSRASRRTHLLHASGAVVEEKLRLSWLYSASLHDRARVEHLNEQFFTALRSLISHSLTGGAVRYQPSDFPQAAMSQEELDELLESLV
ncbi:MAG TPA: non-ribosomal peptide synthase/polyketide synthase [Thermoanaerobaculia bacterium]|nr:non-ribosomal peptide synthase/polyketide synthase [Thermoanaerobaculia bacterium]